MIDNGVAYLVTEVANCGEKLALALQNIGIDVTFGKYSENKTDLTDLVDLAISNLNNIIKDGDDLYY